MSCTTQRVSASRALCSSERGLGRGLAHRRGGTRALWVALCTRQRPFLTLAALVLCVSKFEGRTHASHMMPTRRLSGPDVCEVAVVRRRRRRRRRRHRGGGVGEGGRCRGAGDAGGRGGGRAALFGPGGGEHGGCASGGEAGPHARGRMALERFTGKRRRFFRSFSKLEVAAWPRFENFLERSHAVRPLAQPLGAPCGRARRGLAGLWKLGCRRRGGDVRGHVLSAPGACAQERGDDNGERRGTAG